MERTKLPLDEYALEIFSSDAYLSVNKKLLIFYGPDIAIFLSNLIDRYKYLKSKKELVNDWFFLTHSEQEKQTGLTLTKLRNCKAILKEQNILEVQLKGAPPKEMYKINLSLLTRTILTSIVNRQDSGGLNVRNPDGSIIINNYINNIPIDKKPKAKERNKIYLPIAEYLSRIIQRNKNIIHTNSQLMSWTDDIRHMVEDNGITTDRIFSALHWYRKNIGGQYIPIIESGKSLREKFQKLEAAEQRENNSSKPNNKASIIDDGIKYLWDPKSNCYRHCKTNEVYIP
jgi:hypothetical protein